MAKDAEVSEKKSTDSMKDVMYSYSADTEQLEVENRLLRETVGQLQNELMRFQQPALMICDVVDVFDENKHAIIKVPNGNQFYVHVASSCDPLTAGDCVLCEQKNLTVIRKQTASRGFDVEKFVIIESPKVSFKDIGGLDEQVEQIREVIELPLKKPKLFKDVGIEPPKGILLYGPPGTGKTMLAKAVAASSKSTFIEIVGSELVQKFIGEGAKMVKEIFDMARQRAPAIIFIDEIDALCARRIDVGTSGEREVQRTFMQFLAEIDGFKPLSDVKIIGCTNRKDIMDTAILRPGRLDRLIHVPNPTKEGIVQIFKIHTSRMNLEEFDLDPFYGKLEGFSGAEIKSICTEAGYVAIRDGRQKISLADLNTALQTVLASRDIEEGEPAHMYG